MMGVNTASFELAQDVDRAVIKPLAMAYKKALPKPARIGFKAIRNISAPIVFINDLLQLKPGRALETSLWAVCDQQHRWGRRVD